MDDIEDLRREIAELREDAQRADANLAFLLGMLLEDASFDFSFGPTATIDSINQPGWNAALVERMSAGRELLMQEKRDRLRRERRDQR